METPKQFTIIYSHNCSAAYLLSPPSYLQLPAGTQNTSISIQYTGSNIPPMCMLRFVISSLTSNNYQISNPILYVTGSKSIDRSSLKAPMRLKISSTPGVSSDVGAIILTEQTESILPVFYQLKELTAGANQARFSSSVSEPGTIYYTVMKIGTNRNKVVQD